MNARKLAAALAAISLGIAGAALATEKEDSHRHQAAAQSSKHDSHGAHQEHHSGHTMKLALNQGRKWSTDEPLRQGMNDIRTALTAHHTMAKADVTSEHYKALGETVEYQVGKIVENCKLEPAADANLHIIVADLVAAADTLQGKNGEAPRHGTKKAVMALNQYARYFDHPGFQPLR